MAEPIAWGVAGAGRAAASFARGLRLVPGARLAAVCSRTQESAQAFAARFGVKRVCTSIDDLASDDGVGVVFVASPNHLHAAHARALLARGKAVVCEKPFALTAGEALEVVAAARQAERFCMEAMWTRFLPATREIVRRVAAGDIGAPRLLVAELGLTITAADSPARYDPGRGGGALLDLGVYPVSLASALLGTPEHVEGTAQRAPSGVELSGEALLAHASGARAVLAFGFERTLANDAWIFGTEGRIHVPGPMHRPESFTIERFERVARARASGGIARVLDTPLGQRAHAALRRLSSALAPSRAQTLRFAARGNGYCHQLEAATECLRAGERECALMPLAESVSVLETLDRVRASFGAPAATRSAAASLERADRP